MAKEKFVISYSRLKAWRRCHRLHYYKFVQEIQPKKISMPLFKGNVAHDCLEAHLRGKDWRKIMKKFEKQFNKLFREEREQLGDVIGNMTRVMEGYLKLYAGEKLKTLAVEERIDFPLFPKTRPEVIFSYQCDRVVRDDKGREWVFERKTPKTIPDESIRMSDFQTVLYKWARDKIKPTAGIIWDYVRSKAPTIPQELVRGGLSVAKNIDTTYEVYMGEIKRLKLKPKDYAERLESLRGAETKFYRRVYMTVDPGVTKQIVDEMKETVKEILRNPESKVRTLARECNWCDMNKICQAELRGLDTDFILNTEYEKSTYEGLHREETEDED